MRETVAPGAKNQPICPLTERCRETNIFAEKNGENRRQRDRAVRASPDRVHRVAADNIGRFIEPLLTMPDNGGEPVRVL